MASLTGKSQDPGDGIQSSRKEDPHTTPGGGSAGKKGTKKKRKKKKRNTTEEKTGPLCEPKKRGHPSTPSYSDESEKPQPQQKSTNAEKRSDPNPNRAKSRPKEWSAVKSHKGKKPQPTQEATPGFHKGAKSEARGQTLESLRWEGALDDPVAEAERLEVYKANRRKRYMAVKETLKEIV